MVIGCCCTALLELEGESTNSLLEDCCNLIGDVAAALTAAAEGGNGIGGVAYLFDNEVDDVFE